MQTDSQDIKSTVYVPGSPLSAAISPDISLAQQQAILDFNVKKADAVLEAERWRARRLMAWGGCVSMLLVTASMLFLVPTDRLEKLTSAIEWFYMTTSGVIGVYIGGSMFEYISSVRKRRDNQSPYSMVNSSYGSGRLNGIEMRPMNDPRDAVYGDDDSSQ